MKTWSLNFDLDDNLFYLDTTIILYHKKTLKSKEISTGEFAIVKRKIGVSGKYKNYMLVDDDDVILDKKKKRLKSSFYYFRDFGNDNFTPQLKKAIKNKEGVLGPSFSTFCDALNNKSKARWVSIITARGHNPTSIYNGLKYLKKLGYFKYLPLLKNIHPIANKKYKGSSVSAGQKKLDVILGILNQMKKLNKNIVHSFHFSDDDQETINYILNGLSSELGSLENIKIRIHHTKKNRYKKHILDKHED